MIPIFTVGSLNKKPSGFTLIELAVVVLILSIGIGIALPMLSPGVYGNDFKTGLRRLHAIVNQARYEAIMHNTPVILHIDFPEDNEGHSTYYIKNTKKDNNKISKQLFSGKLYLASVKKRNNPPCSLGEVELFFLPHGLAEPATFDVVFMSKRYKIQIQPFLSRLIVKSG